MYRQMHSNGGIYVFFQILFDVRLEWTSPVNYNKNTLKNTTSSTSCKCIQKHVDTGEEEEMRASV